VEAGHEKCNLKPPLELIVIYLGNIVEFPEL
jgi:hypothetical protein